MKIKSLLLLGLLTLCGMNAFAVDYKTEGIWYDIKGDGTATVVAISSGMTDAAAATITIPATIKDGEGNTVKVTGFEGTWENRGTAADKDVSGLVTTLNIDVTNYGGFGFNFSGLSALTTIALSGTNAAKDITAGTYGSNKVTTLDLSKVKGKDKVTISDATGTSLATINMPEQATEIAVGAFSGAVLTAIDLTYVKKIGANAFNGNSTITTLTIPAGVEEIAQYAFNWMTGLKTVTINLDNDKQKKIDQWFDGCPIETLTINAPQVTEIAADAFNAGVFTTIDLSACAALTTVNAASFPKNAYTSVKLQGTALDNANFTLAQEWLTVAAGSLTEITFPDALTTVGGFANFTALKAVGLPKGLKTIANQAFMGSGLEAIKIKNKVEEIGEEAFKGCPSLVKVNFEDATSLKTVGANAFYQCAKLETVDLSGATALETIGQGMFAGTGLKTVKIPATVKTIDAWAFAENAELESVDFSEASGLKEIKTKAFTTDPKLLTIDLTGATALTTVANDAFPATNAYTSVLLAGSGLVTADPYDDGFTAPFTAILANSKGSLTEITLPSGLIAIADNQFKDFTALESISLPKALVTIGASAFEGSGLTAIKIRENVETIGEKAFNGSKLTSINFTEGTAALTIGTGAFANLWDGAETGLTSVAFPANLVKIGSGAFTGCKLLATVDFSQAAELTTIGQYAFNEYGAAPATAITEIDLTGAVKLETVYANSFPQNEYTSVKLAGTQLSDTELNTAFNKDKILKNANESLTEISFPEGYDIASFNSIDYFENLASIGLPADLDEIPDNAFKGANITAFEVGANIKRVGKHAFDGSKLESIDFSKATALTLIDNYAFANTKFEAVGLPKNLETIGENAFEKSALKSIKIKSHVKKIGAYAFNESANLENVNFEDANALETIGGMAFAGTKLTTIDLDGATALTSISDTWGVAFPENNEYTSVKTAGTLLAGIDPVTDSPYDNFSAEFGAILANSKATLSEITLPAGLQIVDGHQFEGFTAIESISLPKGLKGIEPYAFAKSGLTAIKIRENVEYIGEHAFGGCENLATVNLSEAAALETIGEAAFAAYAFGDEDAPVIESVVIPAAVKTIGVAAFYNAAALATVDFSQAAALETIGEFAFAGTAITAIDLTASPALATISGAAASAFPANEYTSIKLAGTLLPIAQFASIDLSEATATLSEVTLPGANVEMGFEGVTVIPEDLFASVRYAGDPSDPETYKPFTALKSVSLPKSVKEIGNNAFRASGLTAFKFRENIEKIGMGAFADCADLATVNFSEATKLVQIGGTAFAKTAIKEVVIPENENGDDLTIGGFAFADSKLKSFSAKSWAGDVAEGLFMNTKLTGIKFPVAITGIDDGAFSGCAKLESVVFQYGKKDAGLVNGIGDYAFRGCAALAALDLSTTKLVNLDSQYPFEGCTSLAEITFPEELESLNSNGLFADCPIENFEAPTVTVSGVLFGRYNYLLDEDDPTTITYGIRDADHANTTLKTVKIGGSIPANCFAFCTALEEVEWIDNGGNVAANAFNHCTGLKTFTFEPDDAILSLVVNDNAFYGCVPFVDFVTNANYFDYIATHHDGIAPTNTTFGDAKPTFVTTVQDKANANQFVAKYVNNGSTPVSIDAAEAKVYSIYVDGDAAYFQACRTFDGKYIIQPASEDRGNHVIIVTTEAKDVTVTRESRRLLYTYSGQTSIAFDDVYDSKEGDDLADVQTGARVTAGTYLYRLTNTAGQGFGFTFFKGTTIKEGQFFVACSKKPSGAGRLNVVWLDEDGNVENEATGINTIESNDVENGAIYNLQGVRVENPSKGLFIKNGKKVVVK